MVRVLVLVLTVGQQESLQSMLTVSARKHSIRTQVFIASTNQRVLGGFPVCQIIGRVHMLWTSCTFVVVQDVVESLVIAHGSCCQIISKHAVHMV
jgi:hypothetical protein